MAELLARRRGGMWRGRLSSSALSTALATFCLAEAARLRGDDHTLHVAAGLRWLVRHQNRKGPDEGGYGDTVRSRPNLPTTMLSWASLRGCLDRQAVPEDLRGQVEDAARRASAWIAERAGGLASADLERTILGLYGDDHTFSVPILTFCALAGVLDDGAWHRMPRLPFELAVLPRGLFRFIGLPVVSYALPALIAIGRVQHHHAGGALGWLRGLFLKPAMGRLSSVLPESGGFLEAIPLTAFVTTSLLRSGAAHDPVTERCLGFLRDALRELPGDAPHDAPDAGEPEADASGWAIDIELATWVTSLSVDALGTAGALSNLPRAERDRLRDGYLGQQWNRTHPFTGAAPGGWAWTDLPGGVPDADDTSGALLALHALAACDPDGTDRVRLRRAAASGLRWLVDLQNRDGGIPTFCRGWARLPFDRSTPDLTAHTLRAFAAWENEMPVSLRLRIRRSRLRALGYLEHQQRDDGAWLPLWFGNENVPENANPVYGTARVLRALCGESDPAAREMSRRAADYLVAVQGEDGGWGGAEGVESSVEETALAAEALVVWRRATAIHANDAVAASCERAARRLVRAWDSAEWRRATPIGFYFANLWYYEDLYPLIFTVGAVAGLSEG